MFIYITNVVVDSGAVGVSGVECCSEPVQRRDAVDGSEAAARRHHVEAVAAVTWHVEVMSRVSVLHHDDEPGPAVGQVVTGHPLSTLWSTTVLR